MKKAPGRKASAKKTSVKRTTLKVVRPKPQPATTPRTARKLGVTKAATKKSTGKAVAKRARPERTPAKTITPRPITHKATVRAKVKKPAGQRIRRMIFVDVENTSSEERLLSALDHLKIDRRVETTDLVAIGNWKAVGARTARLLGRSGAQLIHSAPATGVRDWSDLWIAVAAGRWIAHADAGDRLDIISDDQAFDAVADAASAVGVDFHRTSFRTLTGIAPEPAPVVEERERPRRRRRGGRGRKPAGLGVVPNGTVAAAPARASAASPVTAVVPSAGRHHGHAAVPRAGGSAPAGAVGDHGPAASPEAIRDALRHLTGGDTERWVNLDLVGNALRAQGYGRPPGSARLVTRVRLLHDVEVSPTGMVRFKPDAGVVTEANTELPVETPPAAPGDAENVAAAPPRKAPRPRRRSPRRKAAADPSEA